MSEQAAAAAKVLKEVGGFEILSKVGQGGMGAVFKARQKSLDRIVALKVLPPNIARDRNFIERFVREARASAKLTHPNVVTGIDVGQDQATGLWYFAMEFVDGPTCKQLLLQQKRLPEDQALRIAQDIAGALECAHQNGMVHRDVKPDNILLNKSGTAKLADLGLARHENDDAGLTQAGMALGTPFYMAPEQVRGEIDHLDTRADLYALGATLFHLVTGQPPFAGETSAVIMARHLSDPPPMANRICSEVSSGCSKLILKLMQKDKAQRLQTPLQLIEQIDRLLKLPAAARGLTTGPRIPVKGATTTAPRDAVRPRLQPQSAEPTPKSRGPLYAGAGAGMVLLLGLLAFLMLPSRRPPRPEHATAPAPNASPAQPVVAPTPPTPESTPSVSPLERRWQDAKAFAQARPDDFAEILKRYQQVARDAEGSPLADAIEAAMATVQKKLDAAASEALTSLKKRMTERSAEGDYDGALAASRALPPSIAACLAEKLEALRSTLANEALARIQAALQKAEAASADADPVAGLKALEPLAGVKFQPMAEDVQKLKQRLETELANVDELKARKALRDAQKRLSEVLGRYDSARLDARDDSAATRIAKDARNDAALDPVRAQADALETLLNAAETERKRQADALESLKGRPFTLGKDQGTIERIADGAMVIKISLDGGKITASKTLKIEDLSQEQKDELFPPLKEIPEALRVEQALQSLTKGHEDLAAATRLLESAPDFPLTPHYLDLIQSRKAAVMEAEAQRAWTALTAASANPIQRPEQALPVFEKLTAFSEAYGQTQFAADHADEIAALRSKLEQIANPNLIKNGGFETGTLDGWDVVVDKPENAQLVTENAHTGKSCMRLARGSISQILQLEPGQTYEASCWVKRSEYMGSVAFHIDDSMDPQLRKQSPLAQLTEWTHWSIVFTAQKNEHKLTVALITAPTAPGAVFVDEVQITRPGSAPVPKVGIPTDAVRFNGHAYKFFPTPLAFRDAQQRCLDMGGHLLTATTEAEQEFMVKTFASADQQLWVGLVKQGEAWGWVTGEPLQLNHWVGGAPDAGEAARIVPPGCKWNACKDARTFGFICEWDGETPATGTAAAVTQQPPSPALQTPAAAQFIAEDAKMQGNWKRFLGKDGYLIQGDETKLPPYAEATCTGQPFTWEKATADVRGLERASGAGRIAACWYAVPRAPMVCDIKLLDGKEHSVALYFLDWKDRKPVTQVEVVDAASGKVLDTRVVGNYVGGKYLAWRVKGALQFRFTIQSGNSVLLSGIFFQ